jgi:putative restriction endonuclease
MPAIIVENDQSEWSDQTGALYHFPKRYLPMLLPGARVIYYKGRIRDQSFAGSRLSPDPHYFGIARIGRVYPDPNSAKGDHFATIEGYRPFASPVGLRDKNGATFESIPGHRVENYWRDGVRSISDSVYDRILERSAFTAATTDEVDRDLNWPTTELQSAAEGTVREMYTTVYERNPRLRIQALAIHGTTCFGCRFNFEERYGPHGSGFIHIHHLKPLHSLGGPETVNPETDLIPVCPNCHSMIHRRKNHTLSLGELQGLLRSKPPACQVP